MLELNREQRAALATMVADIGNIAAGALGFGQFLSDRPLAVGLGALGATVWLTCLVVVATLTKRSS